MAPYFMENLDKIRHTVVKLSPVSADALGQQQKFEEKDGIITSNRLDSMIACVYKFSRSQALEFFKAEKVFVNGKCVQNPSYRCKEADIISVRGYGRFVFEREMCETINHLLLICPLSSRQVKYLKLDVDDACISF